MDEEATKRAIKEAVREWLDEEMKNVYQGIGIWIVRTFVALLVAAAVYLVLWANGFKHH